MPNSHSNTTKTRKEVKIPPTLHAMLTERKESTRLDLVDQTHLALEKALAQHQRGEPLEWNGPIPVTNWDEEPSRFPVSVTQEFWNDVKRAAKMQGRNLMSFTVVALLRWLDETKDAAPGGVTPATPQVDAPKSLPQATSAVEGISQPSGEQDELEKVRQVVREEIRRATRPLPPKEAGKLLSELGEWTRPKGSEYLLSGQANAGPWRNLEDLPEGQLLSDYEILEWKDGQDLMLVITEDAKDGVCLIGDDIYPNDILHFRAGLVPENGEIVVVIGYNVDGTPFGTIKHFYKTKDFIDEEGHGYVELRPSNPACETICAYEPEIDIRGVLHNHIRRNFRARNQMKRRLGLGIDYMELTRAAA